MHPVARRWPILLAVALATLGLGTPCRADAGQDPVDADRDGLVDAADPCPADPRNRCFGPVALTPDGVELRVNAGRKGRRCNVIHTDCTGDRWAVDFGSTRLGRSRRCLASRGCTIRGVQPVFGCVDCETTALFRCTRRARILEPALSYELALSDGLYLVNLMFHNPTPAEVDPPARVVDIVIESELAYDDLDLGALPSGGVAVRSALAAVADGSLEIEVARVAGQPLLAAIEVLAAAPTTTTVPACGGSGECDDGYYCNGQELCSPTAGCLSGFAPDCDDAIACTRDTCSESRNACVHAPRCADGLGCSPVTGRCVPDSSDGDNDGLADERDPCPTEPRNGCFGEVAEDAHLGLALRINAGASTHECEGIKRDCTGAVWNADFGSVGAPASGACNLADDCAIGGIEDLFGCWSETTEDLFQCERWAAPESGGLAYAFAVEDGAYLVNLYFANTYSGTREPGSRVFDVFVEGVAAYERFDQVAAAGGSAIAAVRSVVTRVNDGQLDILFAHGVQNPTIKAIEVLRAASSTTTTTLPSCDHDCGHESGNDFLHAAISAPDVLVDFDADGFEMVRLNGSESHTHEPGHRLAHFEWSESGAVFATGAQVDRRLSLGPHEISLTIHDDNQPPESLSATARIDVVRSTEVPGALVLSYPADANATELLEAVDLPRAVLAEVRPSMTVTAGPSDASLLVRMLGRFEVSTAGVYDVRAWGGDATRLTVDGKEWQGPAFLEPFGHQIDARFVIADAAARVPLAVTISDSFGVLRLVGGTDLSHDQSHLVPVLNAAPSTGSEAGGESVVLTGLGFFPSGQVEVRWGDVVLSGGEIDVDATTIRLATPPGSGAVDVHVMTPAGQSNSQSFRYVAELEPVAFTLEEIAPIAQPTQAEWGPDGRLYVASLSGRITAYRLDDGYRVVEEQTIDALVGSDAPNILGIAFDPADVAQDFSVYVAHSQIYAGGGHCDVEGELPYIGRISRLRAPDFELVEPVVTGLPTSNHDHAINGMVFDEHGDLLVAVGGNTNAGVNSCSLGGLPESPLSAALLRVETARADFRGALEYRDRDTGAASSDQRDGERAELVPGTDVHVVAAGLRNCFDPALTVSGTLLCADNGPDVNLGPASTGPDTEAPEPHPSEQDSVDRLVDGGYYGHPNRNRGRMDPRQTVYRGAAEDGATGTMPALAIVPSSSNGLVEYRAATFGGALRGSLLLQKWNGKTMSLRLSADQTSVEEISDLPTSMESLDLTTGPGGALIGADLTDHRIVIARPIEARDGPMAVYDVHPWRGTVEGGFRFVLGGRRLASAQAPVVRFGDVVAQVTSASPTRIEGVVPGRSDVPPGPVDITVSTGSETKVLPDAFRYLPARGEARGGACRITIDSGGSLPGSSTYSSGSFRIENLSSNGQHIERVRFDLRSALLRDLAFDPDGLAGDRVGKDLTIDSPGEVQVAGHAFLQPRSGGYDVLEIEFSSFPPGAVLRFSVDIDPTSIRGEPAPGPGASGSVSGLELAGAAVEVTLDDRVLLRGETFPTSGSLTGSTVLLNGTTLSRPLVDLLGAQSVADPQEVLRVHAPAGTEIRLLVAEAGRFVGEQGGFDLQPDETNSLLAVTEHAATVSEAGYVDLPVSLTRSAPEGGWNVITAVARSEGATSRLAPTRVVRLAPSP